MPCLAVETPDCNQVGITGPKLKSCLNLVPAVSGDCPMSGFVELVPSPDQALQVDVE